MAQDFIIASTGAGDTTLVAAPGSRQFIRVYNYHMTASATVTAALKSGSTVKCTDYLGTGNSPSPADDVNGIFDCAIGEALVLTQTGAGNIGGCGKYSIYGPPQ